MEPAPKSAPDIPAATAVRQSVSRPIQSRFIGIILRPDENVLLGNSRTGAALLFELILGKDLKFASRLDNRGFAFLGEEIDPALCPDRQGRASSSLDGTGKSVLTSRSS